ncbi:GntR family transcriptional regulator [Brevibacterium sanguinis]|uniref:GntR family transcriptional regulator n=2 Tax=Brevibacterium TaxID=1696 RepID=A0A366ILT0_9MICO|nr:MULTISPECIES: FCD domain-containing protein [Brevibacterium]RBP67153.1 GntR family transcriptional regulator [Brevibacterium sanguinis]RBP73678.1 GntR family transcriptional regulator [Brevibacterium celere]
MKAHEKVMDWVTEELRSGRLRIGDHLPGERALAEELQVSRGSIREALRVLEALGTIGTATGSGPRSGTIVTAAPEQALTLALNMQLATSHVEASHVYEMRQLLETWAAEHATAEAPWDDAERLLDLMDDPELPLEEFLPLDAEFHVTLSRAADNPLISTLMDALRTSIADHTLARARALPDWKRTAARLRSEHRAIYTALRDGEPGTAARLLHDHIEGYYLETSPESSD